MRGWRAAGLSPSVDLDHVGQVVAEDPARFGHQEAVLAASRRGRDLDVGNDATDTDVVADDFADTGLDGGPLPLRDLAQEGLLLRVAEIGRASCRERVFAVV